MISLPDFKMSRCLLLIATFVVTAQSDAGIWKGTTGRVTFTEHADVKCTETFGRKYTVTALNIICEKDPECSGYEFRGNLGTRCSGELKFGDGSDDDTLGMK